MKHVSSRNLLLGALGAATALVAVVLAQGGDSPTPGQSSAAGPSSSGAGMMVAKDPVTGALRAPTAEEAAALQPVTRAGAESRQLRSQRLANGAVVTTLDSSYDVYNVAVKGPDGKIQHACVSADKVEAAQSGKLNSEDVLDEK